MAGNSFEWDDCVLIKFGTGKAVTLPVERVDGRTFFHLVKSSSPVRHLLQSKCDHDTTTKQARVLHKTNIVERITALRDEQFKSMLTTDHVPEYLRNRYGNKRMRAGVLGLPQVFEVEAPSVDQVAGVTMALLGTKPKSKLMAELTVANLDYLASVVEQQNSSGHILKQHPRTHVDAPEGTSVPGVTIAHSREAYLAKFKDNDGVVHTKLAFWKRWARTAPCRRRLNGYGRGLTATKAYRMTMRTLPPRMARITKGLSRRQSRELGGPQMCVAHHVARRPFLG